MPQVLAGCHMFYRETDRAHSTLFEQATNEVDVSSPPVSAPVSPSATPLGSSYADLSAAEDLGDGDLEADEADTAAADGDQPVIVPTLDQEVGARPWRPGAVAAGTAGRRLSPELAGHC